MHLRPHQRLWWLVAAFAAVAFALATAGTAAAAEAGGAVGPSYTINPPTHVAQIEGAVTCLEADSALAVLTLRQRGSGGQLQTFATVCGSAPSSVPFVLTFTGFHPGPATLQACFYAFSGTFGVDVACSEPFRIVLKPTH
jgi:hypothetical protein